MSTDIKDIKRLRLEPGDVLVATVPKGLSSAELRTITEAFRSGLPQHKVLLMVEPCRLDVLTPANTVVTT